MRLELEWAHAQGGGARDSDALASLLSRASAYVEREGYAVGSSLSRLIGALTERAL